MKQQPVRCGPIRLAWGSPMATRTFREKYNNNNNNNKADSIFRINFQMSLLTWTTEKELEREIKNKGDQLRWKKNIEIL